MHRRFQIYGRWALGCPHTLRLGMSEPDSCLPLTYSGMQLWLACWPFNLEVVSSNPASAGKHQECTCAWHHLSSWVIKRVHVQCSFNWKIKVKTRTDYLPWRANAKKINLLTLFSLGCLSRFTGSLTDNFSCAALCCVYFASFFKFLLFKIVIISCDFIVISVMFLR